MSVGQTTGRTETPPALIALRRVVRAVGQMIPRGFTGDHYWTMTVPTHDELMSAYEACLREDTDQRRDHFRWCAGEWVKAWEKAIQAWEDDQSPTAH